MLEKAGLQQREWERWDVDNAVKMGEFVNQTPVSKLAKGLVNGMRESEAATSLAHECMASAVPDFSGAIAMHRAVSPGCEALARTNVRLTLVFYYHRSDCSYK